jgi:GDP-mannose transporter
MSNSQAVWSCSVYSLFSMSMVLVNKMVVTTFGFKLAFSLLFFQSLVAVGLAVVGRSLKLITFEDLKSQNLRKWLPINIIFCVMLFTGFKTCVRVVTRVFRVFRSLLTFLAVSAYRLQYLAVSLVTIFKNLTNIIILAGDWYFFGQTASRGIVLSLLLVLMGAVAAGIEDISFSLIGYFWMALNCLATAGYGTWVVSVVFGRCGFRLNWLCGPQCSTFALPSRPSTCLNLAWCTTITLWRCRCWQWQPC